PPRAGLRPAAGIHHAHLVAVARTARVRAGCTRAVRDTQPAGRRPDSAAAAPHRHPRRRTVPAVAARCDPGERAPGTCAACALDLGARLRRDRPAGPGKPVAAVPGTRTMSARALALCGMLAGAFAAHAANIDANAGAALRAAVAIEQARPPAQTLPREAFLDSRALQV